MYYFSQHATSVDAINAYQTPLSQHFIHMLTSRLTLWIAIGVISVVTLGGFWKMVQLSHGGKSIAESLGGRRIDPNTQNPEERKILNVVEEMAIASGNPVPPVYLLSDNSINAFAAGLTRRDAIIGVTNGCVNLLNRDELQGVMAHEFSHIHNGDMRLNMRLTAILHGILLIGLIGQFILRGNSSSYYYRSSHSRREGNKAQLLGLVLMIIGYGGTFFGNIIKAAVSRQREFLADASAVQFTRNPIGISGALKKIGGATSRSHLSSANAQEFSHFYFAAGVTTFLGSMMATHPPLSDRIKRIEPRWSGTFPKLDESKLNHHREKSNFQEKEHVAQFTSYENESNSYSQKSKISEFSFTDTIENKVGEATPESIAETRKHIEAIPNTLHEACLSGFSARTIIYSLLLENKNKSIHEQQIKYLKDNAHPATFKVLQVISEQVLLLPREHYLSLINLCIPALKNLSKPQYRIFKQNLVALIKIDKKITLFEWCLYRIIIKTLEAKDTPAKFTLKETKNSLTNLLSVVAQFSSENSDKNMDAAYIAATNHLKISLEERKRNIGIHELDKTLDTLEQLKPLEKPKLLKSISEIICHDNKVTPTEKELFRAIGDTLNCPIPPI